MRPSPRALRPSRSALPFLLVLAAVLATAAVTAPAHAEPPEGRLLRFPDIHGDFVVFAHAGDLWRAPVAGGAARRLTSHAGLELFPKISQDGKWIAYTAEYTGTRQVYVMPAEGGDPRQLTYYNDVGAMPPRGGWDNWILGWTSEGKILVRMNRTPWGERMGRYYLVDPKGGLETPLPIPHGGSASLSPDGRKIAYTPIDREFRTWKRTRGGRAQDIWIYDFSSRRSERVTDYVGTDNFPMWVGGTIYFTSDREHTLNLFALDVASRAVKKVTDFKDYDVLWPSMGPGAIVFVNGGYLYRFDVASGKTARIDVRIGAEEPFNVPQWKTVSGRVQSAALSPSGARAIFEARGELFTVPAKDGATRNLSGTQGVREMAPAWSPDGKWIAYLSDATGEYEFYVRPADGSGTPRQLTSKATIWRFGAGWSPDSKKLAFGDRDRRLWIVDVATGALTEVDRDERDDITTYRWSPDSRWIAYERNHPSRQPGIALYSLDQKKHFLLGDGMTADFDPQFSGDGKYLFFLSNRDFNLTFSAFEFDYLYTRATRVYAAALDPAAPALFPPKSDEEKGKEDPAATSAADKKDADKKDADKKDADKKDAKAATDRKDAAKPAKDEVKPIVVEVEGFAQRVIALPGLPAAVYRGLGTNADAVWYVRTQEGGGPTLYRFDLKERKEAKVMDGVFGYELSADGKKLLWRTGGDWGIADARAGLSPGDGKLDLSGLKLKLDVRAEYRQMFEDGWRITRDWFYDAKMHGVDWKKMHDRYAPLVEFIAHRNELDFLLGEMVGELNAGHTYVSPGDEPQQNRVLGGMLGAEFVADPSGRYRIGKIYRGENWHDDFRSPLTEPGVDVKTGAFVLAIDGADLTTSDNPYRLLEGKANQPVVLTVNDKPSDAGARKVTVRPIASELDLMYIDWVRSRMELTERLSGGRIGYMHLPNTAVEGNRMLQKMFYGQVTKPALIVDDRYNGGGFIPVRMIEYLQRRTMAWWLRRDVDPMRSPEMAHNGPKAMLINGYSSSGGDALPYWFKAKGLGPLIGTRTWGGLIGLSGNPNFVDGGGVEVPTFRIFDGDGKWVVENEGVSPDIEVFDTPDAFDDTRDASIEKAVEVLLKELEKSPVREPKTPTPPDESGRK